MKTPDEASLDDLRDASPQTLLHTTDYGNRSLPTSFGENNVQGVRNSSGERRKTIIAVATDAFGRGGYTRTTTEEIAIAAGVSQPYVSKLFGSKRSLFKHVVEQSYRTALETLMQSASGLTGTAAFEAMEASCMAEGSAPWLQVQLQAHAQCVDDEIKSWVANGNRDLSSYVTRVSGEGERVVRRLFAEAMIAAVLGKDRGPMDPAI